MSLKAMKEKLNAQIEQLAEAKLNGLETRAIEEQIEILEQLLIPTSRTNPIRFSEGLRNQIRKKLSKMTIGRMEASLRPVKLQEKSITQWAFEEDPIAARDAEFEKFMKGGSRATKNHRKI